MGEKIISIIPARGGSKGIRKKNILPIAGKPLIVHTIQHSLSSKLIDETIVSTDNKMIKEISEEYGARVITRPKYLARDATPTEPVIQHVIDTLRRENNLPEIIAFLQCTSPLRRKKDIDNQIKLLIDNNYGSVFCAYEKPYFIWKYCKNKLISFNFNNNHRPRRQDRDKEFVETGSAFVFRRGTFEKSKNRICGNVGVYIIPYEYSFEIDTPFDFWLCEQILKKGG